MKKLSFIVTGSGRCGTLCLAKSLSSCGIICGHESIFTNKGLDEALDRLKGKSKIYLSHCARMRENNWLPNLEDIQADSSYLAAPFLNNEEFKDIPIIHVVRNPIKVINSFVNGLGYFRSSKPLWHPVGLIEKIDNSEPSDPNPEEVIIGKPLECNFHKFIYKFVPELKEEMTPLTRAALFWIKWNQIIESNIDNRKYMRVKIEDSFNKVMNFCGIKNRTCYNTKTNSSFRERYYSTVIDIEDNKIKNDFIEMSIRYGYANKTKGTIKFL